MVVSAVVAKPTAPTTSASTATAAPKTAKTAKTSAAPATPAAAVIAAKLAVRLGRREVEAHVATRTRLAVKRLKRLLGVIHRVERHVTKTLQIASLPATALAAWIQQRKQAPSTHASVGSLRLFTVDTSLKNSDTTSSSTWNERLPTNRVSLSGLTTSPNFLARAAGDASDFWPLPLLA